MRRITRRGRAVASSRLALAVAESLEQRTLLSFSMSVYGGWYAGAGGGNGHTVSATNPEYNVWRDHLGGVYYEPGSNNQDTEDLPEIDAVFFNAWTEKVGPGDVTSHTMKATAGVKGLDGRMATGGPPASKWIIGFGAPRSVSFDVTHQQDAQYPAGWMGFVQGYGIDFKWTTDECSAFPVRYADGTPKTCFPKVITHVYPPRIPTDACWSNQGPGPSDVLSVGNGITLDSLPYIADLGIPSWSHPSSPPSLVGVVDHLLGIAWSSTDQDYAIKPTAEEWIFSGGSAGKAVSIVKEEDETNGDIFKITDGSGKVYRFYGFNDPVPVAKRGQVLSITYPGGAMLETEWNQENTRIVGLKWSYSKTPPGGGTPTSVSDHALFSYGTGNQVSQVAYKRDTGSGEDTLTTAVLSYYGASDDHGSEAGGDLKFVETYRGIYDSGNPSNNVLLSKEYFRWYNDDSESQGIGYNGGLKLWMSGDSFRKFVSEQGLEDEEDIDNAADFDGSGNPVAAKYADNHFMYDPQTHKATYERALGAGCGCANSNTGAGIIKYEYAADNPTWSGGRNTWLHKTTEYLPDKTNADTNGDGVVDSNQWSDNDQNIVYTNKWGQPILKIVKDVSENKEYATWYRYDVAGRQVLMAPPSAVFTTGMFNTQTGLPVFGDLVGYDPEDGLGAQLRMMGPVEVTSYYVETASPNAGEYYMQDVAPEVGLVGYPYKTYVQWGDSVSTKVLLTKQTYNDGPIEDDGVYFVAESTSYTGGDGDDPVVTSYNYVSWCQDENDQNTNQVKELVTKLPQVKYTQNGVDTDSGHPSDNYQSTQIFDSNGQVIWEKDANGSINYYEYESVSGTATKIIIDVDTDNTGDYSGDAPWENTGGKHLITLRKLDLQGRVIKETDPNNNVTYTVYDDTDAESSNPDPRETRIYRGWNASTHQPTGPVEVIVEDAANGIRDTLTFTWSDSDGLPVHDDDDPIYEDGSPTGAELISDSYADIQSLTREEFNVSNQLVKRLEYFNLNLEGLPYRTDTTLGDASNDSGDINGNYHQTSFKYDEQGRLWRTKAPTGTITHQIFDALGRVMTTEVGTDDGTGTSNMKTVETREYDGGGIGDGNLTKITADPSAGDTVIGAADDRVTQNWYDWRNRLVASKGGIQSSEGTDVQRMLTYYTLDNGGRVRSVETFDADNVTITTGSNGVPVAPNESLRRSKQTLEYDDQGRLFAAHTFSVDPDDGSESSDSLNEYTWYDKRGSVIKTIQPGGLVTKNEYDGAGRLTVSYLSDGGGDTPPQESLTADSADDVTGDKVVQQTEYSYDANGNVTLLTVRERTHDTTGTGALGLPTIPFVDTVSQGTWHSVYGSEGYSIMQNSASLPGWASLSVTGKSDYTWASSSSDPRATEKADSTGRLAACWYTNTSFDVDLSITDGNTHEVSFYCLDWDSYGRAQTIEMIDPNTSAVLASKSLSDFHDGKWATFQASGNVKFRFTKTGGYNAVVSAIVLDPARTTARTSYTSNYYDAADRLTDTVNVGTNGGQRYIRPANVPSRSSESLVTNYEYATDELQTVVVPSGSSGNFKLKFEDYNPSTNDVTGNIAVGAAASAVQTALANLGGVGSGNVTVTSPSSGIYVVKFTDELTMRDVSELQVDTQPSGGTVTVATSISGQSGALSRTTDPRGLVTLNDVDRAGRTIRTVEGYTDGGASSADDRITQYTYDGSNHVLTLKAVLPGANVFQETKYLYAATTSGGSYVNSNDILTAIWYPRKEDSAPGAGDAGQATSTEEEAYTVNALGEITSKTDRNSSIHDYSYDVLGRLRDDTVSYLGSGVDGNVRLLRCTYNSQGLLENATSYGTTAAGSLRNDVLREYNGFGQITKEYQDHSGSAVNTSTSPRVEYTYTAPSSSTNHARLSKITYPNNRIVRYEYNSGLDDSISRISFLADDSSGEVGTSLEEYTYLGAGTVVKRNRPEPGTSLSYIGASSGASDSGDWYGGFDRFGRVIDQKWASSSTDLDRFKYGYDQDSNVLYKDNTITDSLSGASEMDELYHANGSSAGYDKLNRLTDFRRGELNSAKDSISTASRYQTWTLDALGNWNTLNTNGTNSNKTHNQQNQLTNNGTSNVTYDNNGSMNVIGSGGTSIDYNYDAWNRLVGQVTGGSTSTASHAYDAMGRRVSETPANTAAKRDLYYSTRWQVLEEQDSAGATQVQNVFSPLYVDELVERDVKADGALDPTFDGDGRALSSFIPSDSSSQSKGHKVRMQTVSGTEYILVAGEVWADATTYPAIARFNLDGTLDTSFGTSGVARLTSGAQIFYSLAVQSDGKIVAVGKDSAATTLVCRFTASGSLDTTFDSDGKVNVNFGGSPEILFDVGIDSNGKIVVGGGSGSNPAVARLNSDGSLDTGFDTDGKLTFSVGATVSLSALTIQSDNKIVAVGGISGNIGMIRLNTDGSFDSTFGTAGSGKLATNLGGTESPTGVAIDSNGKIVLSGTKDNNLLALRYTSTGSLDTSFDSDGWITLDLGSSTEGANGLVILSNGKIVLGGYSAGDYALTRLNTDGTKDTSFGNAGLVLTDFGPAGNYPFPGSDYILGVTLQSDGKMVASGYRQHAYFQGAITLARYHMTGSAVRHYVQQDANYNVTSLTSAAGAVMERYRYDPYGTPTITGADFGAQNFSSYGQNYLHQGGRYDTNTGLYHFRNRDLKANDGRWLQVDPLGYVDANSLYSYVNSSPVITRDYSGTQLSGVSSSNEPGLHLTAIDHATGQETWDYVEVVGAKCCVTWQPRWLYSGFASYSSCVSYIQGQLSSGIPGVVIGGITGVGGYFTGLLIGGTTGTVVGAVIALPGLAIGGYDLTYLAYAHKVCGEGVCIKWGKMVQHTVWTRSADGSNLKRVGCTTPKCE
jgi:uncharacterized delta-60 repeat protein/RHS repeat-associated protein